MLISLTDHGRTRKFQLKSMRVFWQGQSSFMHIVNEVTQMEQAQRDRSRMEFQQMMMRNVSHEYRTPLNAIIASTQIVDANDVIPRFQNIACGIVIAFNVVLSAAHDGFLDVGKRTTQGGSKPNFPVFVAAIKLSASNDQHGTVIPRQAPHHIGCGTTCRAIVDTHKAYEVVVLQARHDAKAGNT